MGILRREKAALLEFLGGFVEEGHVHWNLKMGRISTLGIREKASLEEGRGKKERGGMEEELPNTFKFPSRN